METEVRHELPKHKRPIRKARPTNNIKKIWVMSFRDQKAEEIMVNQHFVAETLNSKYWPGQYPSGGSQMN